MKIISAISFAIFILTGHAAFAADVSFGILAPRGELKAIERWTEFGKYLSDSTGHTVKIVPLAPSKVLGAASNNEVSFILSHPAHTVALEHKYGAAPLASLNNNSGSHFAGVIIAKKGSGINNAEDLRGKKVMSLKFKVAAGAYIFQAYHLKQKGIDVHKDFASLKEGQKQDDLVLAVNAGIIDAAFIRSGLLEKMQNEGKIKIDDFIIVDQRIDDELPLLHSTALYPSWYLSSVKGVDTKLANKIQAAALAMTPDQAASKKAEILGFIKPVSLESMKEALKALQITPYN